MEKCSVCGSELSERGYHLENPDCNAGPYRPDLYGLETSEGKTSKEASEEELRKKIEETVKQQMKEVFG